jgi:cardiolipin synthase
MSPFSGLILVDAALRVTLGVHLLLSRRPVSATLAWLMLMLLPVPFIGVLLYTIVGEVRLGRWRLARYNELTADFISRATVFWKGGTQDWTVECEPYRQVSHVATTVGEMPPLRGNRVTFLGDSNGTIQAIIKDIDAAKSRISMLYYIWMENRAGAEVVAALERAAKRGVSCRVLVDAVGSKEFLRSDLPARLSAAGVKFAAALPVNPFRMLFARLDLRNHRKITVVDGWIAYAGSQNLTDAHWGHHFRRVGPYVDATARLEGPAAQALEVVFLRDWEVETEEKLGAQLREFLADVPIPDGGSIVHVVPSGPGANTPAMRQAVITTIFAAREELIITTPYFAPDDATRDALIAAALRGVAVTLVLPNHADSVLVGAAARSHYLDLLEAGVHIKHYRKGLLHSKTITVDSDMAMIGSTNLDMRSFTLNFEVTLFVYDSDEASLLRMLQTSYIDDSDDVFLEDWRRRPLIKRITDNTARLLGPLL